MKYDTVLCKETAELHIDKMASAWGMFDAKAVISGGKESSIPDEMHDQLLASVMMGRLQISEDGKTITHVLAEETAGETKLTYGRTSVRKHNLTEIQEGPENDQLFALAQVISGATDHLMSEMATVDLGITAALVTYLSFT